MGDGRAAPPRRPARLTDLQYRGLSTWRSGADIASAARHIAVGDTGPGVPAALHARVFEPLFTTKPKASGLGLALARRVVEAHGGTIVLAPSEVGALFVLRVPADG